MAIFGSLATVRAQTSSQADFAAAFDYLGDVFKENSSAGARLRGIAVGETRRIELAGGAFALEQVYLSKRRADGFFESHRKYIDVQVLFEGHEWMEVIDLASARQRDPYNEDRDFIAYHDNAEASVLRVGAGDAAVFFPADVHMPTLCGATAPLLVRKIVVKVPVVVG